ncbi:helix-turn-helix domain-containing protein [Thermococcus sp. MAR1]|uniref:helix-turn-helix domain-containing protein n=1 Tax=Thermococcus sp. MAR1 TaxID=1638263 RepID=UPI0014394581|nr:helix-turn-helix domain-containing protein [Thermococcus sp. MAR1]NJE09900.1 hypothetical protein [Thermococcus sp. MAR1]
MPLSCNEIEEILRLYNEGVSVREIAGRYKVSERRIYQIVKNPILKKPGRPRRNINHDVKELIIKLRQKRWSSKKIHEHLIKNGIEVSYYHVWRIAREWDINKLSRELFGTTKDYERVLGIFVTRVKLRNGFLKLFVLGDISSSKVLEYGVDPNLKCIVSHIKGHILPETLIIIQRSPPLVPTRGNNHLTRFLNEANVDYVWITRSQLRRLCNCMKKSNIPLFENKEEFINWFNNKGLDLLENSCELISKKFMELRRNGNIRQNTQFSQNEV